MNIGDRSDQAWEVYGEYPSVVDDSPTWLASELRDAACRLACRTDRHGARHGTGAGRQKGE